MPPSLMPSVMSSIMMGIFGKKIGKFQPLLLERMKQFYSVLPHSLSGLMPHAARITTARLLPLPLSTSRSHDHIPYQGATDSPNATTCD